MAIQYQGDSTFDALCSSPFRPVSAATFPRPTNGLSYPACLTPIPIAFTGCCRNCFKVAWPGLDVPDTFTYEGQTFSVITGWPSPSYAYDAIIQPLNALTIWGDYPDSCQNYKQLPIFEYPGRMDVGGWDTVYLSAQPPSVVPPDGQMVLMVEIERGWMTAGLGSDGNFIIYGKYICKKFSCAGGTFEFDSFFPGPSNGSSPACAAFAEVGWPKTIEVTGVQCDS